MMSERVDTDTLHIDEMHVVCPRAGGLDVHKMCITAAVRLCEAGRGFARTAPCASSVRCPTVCGR